MTEIRLTPCSYESFFISVCCEMSSVKILSQLSCPQQSLKHVVSIWFLSGFLEPAVSDSRKVAADKNVDNFTLILKGCVSHTSYRLLTVL